MPEKVHEMIIFFCKIIFHSKMVLRTRRMQFSQLRLKLLAQSPHKILKVMMIIQKMAENFPLGS